MTCWRQVPRKVAALMPRHGELDAHRILRRRQLVEDAVELGLLENPALDLRNLAQSDLHRFRQAVDHVARSHAPNP
ncbi:hypothetical protein C0Z19_08530 [Trinickia soli]|uniref:Uncharacterized protein n=1 Tax=Trinickia soli TaxID=380675 RepID=A0A2N7W896_9BURK|nr:hypothetical protein C0Z19_08530 [Trinickia soli]